MAEFVGGVGLIQPTSMVGVIGSSQFRARKGVATPALHAVKHASAPSGEPRVPGDPGSLRAPAAHSLNRWAAAFDGRRLTR